MESQSARSAARPLVSVVVPTRDRPNPLRQALESLLAQQVDERYEVLVIDNARAPSADVRQVVYTTAAGSPVPVDYVHEPRGGVAHARNRGVRAAVGRWIAFCDDDQVADPAWLRALLAAARRQDAACVGGAIRLDLPPGTRTLTALGRRLLGEQPLSGVESLCRGREIPSAGNLLVEKQAFADLGGFDASMTAGGEDSEWVRRALRSGRRVVWTPSAIVHHRIPPHRTDAAYLRWVAARAGAQRAYIDWKHFGRAWLLTMAVARAVHGMGVFAARVLVAPARAIRGGAEDAALGIERARGYVRQACALAWRRHADAPFRSELDMDRERTRFAPTEAGRDTEAT